MRSLVLEVHPWAAVFLDRSVDAALRDLDAAIDSISDLGTERANAMHKLVDQVRRGS
jgi:hypothetical protein